jgi:ABC-type branched-subunit amino acid transport system substrate-binding protein
MGDAAKRTRALTSYLAVSGPATTSSAAPFLGSLLAKGCDVVVAAGAPQEAAVLAEAAKFRRVRFLLAGPGPAGPAAGANVAVVRVAGSGLRAAVAAAVEADTSG